MKLFLALSWQTGKCIANGLVQKRHRYFFFFYEEKFYSTIQSLHYLQCNTYTTYSTILTLLTIQYLHYLQYDTYMTCNTVFSLLTTQCLFFFYKIILTFFLYTVKIFKIIVISWECFLLMNIFKVIFNE